MRYDNVFDTLNSTVWGITNQKFDQISAFVNSLGTKDAIDAAADAQKRAEARSEREQSLTPYERMGIQVQNGVAVVPISGTMTKRMNMFQEISGGTSTEMLTNAVNMLAADDDVQRVVFKVDSPGGSVDGLNALHDAIKSLGKPSAALADGTMASAAYFVASAADKVYATKDAMVGSIGTITSRWDYSEAMSDAGIKQHIWRSGPYKALGHTSEPLTTEESKDTQRMVDSYFQQFVQVVADNRFNGNLELAQAVSDGRVYVGAEAQTNNLVDGIKSMDEIVAEFAADASFETKYETISAAYETAVTALAEKDAIVEAKDAEIERLRADLATKETAAKEEKAKNFVAELVAEGKIAAAADHSAIVANLTKDFDAFSAMFALVPKGTAAPGKFDADTETVPVADLESKVKEAKAAGIPVAYTPEEAEVYEEFQRVEGSTDASKHYVKGYHE